ncbi:hypothetical protein BCR39DRAFT_97062 [Naematelia encephala]|uniref:Uncharacterized protein n=1 Tax=Naematelia encephala TaxID=71784 RepID=A0A1Y2BB16_9TREE|nr:hypothetical protein BCR39DRAFT_97062 [Naematelia encephala]
MSSASSSLRPLLRSRIPCASRSFSSTPVYQKPKDNYHNPWPFKSHLRHRDSPTVPPPLPAIFPQRIVLSDGSTFTSYTTAPTPATLQLTRDVTNNPLWAPGTERRGIEDEEGRVGRFRRRFEGMSAEPSSSSEEEGQGGAQNDVSFDQEDLSWMGEGGKEEKAPKFERRHSKKK